MLKVMLEVSFERLATACCSISQLGNGVLLHGTIMPLMSQSCTYGGPCLPFMVAPQQVGEVAVNKANLANGDACTNNILTSFTCGVTQHASKGLQCAL